jgi:transcriptional regulator with XRE-family HTH domain
LASEFDRANAALARYEAGENHQDDWPPVSSRLRQARERVKLSQESIAARLGILPSEYWDIESYNDEAFTCFSVDQLSQLSAIIGVSVDELLFGSPEPEPPVRTSFTVLAGRLVDLAEAKGLTVEQLSDQLGWDLAEVVTSPESLGTFNIAGLRSVCDAIGIDWRTALPRPMKETA